MGYNKKLNMRCLLRSHARTEQSYAMSPKYTKLNSGPATFRPNFLSCTKKISKSAIHQSKEMLASLGSRKGGWLWETCSHCRDGMHQDGKFPDFPLWRN